MKSKNLIGYDLDGVICENSPKRKKPFFKQNSAERAEYKKERLNHCNNAELKLRPTGNFIIITARKTTPEKVATLRWLEKNELKPQAIYFLDRAKTRENIIKFKADIINKNNLTAYYDDDYKICNKLIKLCENTIISHYDKLS